MLGILERWPAGHVKTIHGLANGTAQEHPWVTEKLQLYNMPHDFEMLHITSK
jgi:hypothetical protein